MYARRLIIAAAVVALAGCGGDDEEPRPTPTLTSRPSGITLRSQGSAPLAEMTAEGCHADATFAFRVEGPADLVQAVEGDTVTIQIDATPDGAVLDGTQHSAKIANREAKFVVRAGPIARGSGQVVWRATVTSFGNQAVPPGGTAQTGFVCP